MARDEYQSPSEKRTTRLTNAANMESLLSPRFRSAAAMAGWDEETLLLATMIVEDTPERETKHKRRTNQQSKTPPASSRRKRKAQQQNPSLIPIGAICLDDEVNGENVVGSGKKNAEIVVNEEKKKEGDEGSLPAKGGCSSSIPAVPCMDRLREELSCAICLEICFEPSTTTCGHSFCKRCLKSAADKCGKRCPKCRQLISNGRSCTVNTVLWNTIQLLFPDEVESRKATTNLLEAKKHRSTKDTSISTRNVTVDDSDITGSINRRRRTDSSPAEEVALTSRRNSSWRRTRRGPSQEEDAALAFRLQREEFIEAFGGIHDHEPRMTLYSARSNLRAMELRLRGRRPV